MIDESADIAAVRDVARKFAKGKVAPRSAELDETGAFPYDLVAEMGQLGFYGMSVGEEYGGSALGTLAYATVVEEVGAADTSVSINITDQSLTASCIANFANEEQRRTWLPRMMTGEILGAFGLTEPGGGSDSGGLKTTARRDGGDWVINGSKQYITNVGTDISKVIVILARTELGNSMFLVPLDLPGVEIGKPLRKMGWRASNTAPVSFDDVRIPLGNLMGEEGRGLKGMLNMLNGGRIGIAANSIGIIRQCLELSVEQSRDRQVFGRSLGDFQATQFKLSEMAMNLELAKLITTKAAKLSDAGLPCSTESSQVHGGYGFTKDFKAEKFYRDVKLCTIGEGTSEIQRMVIARQLLKG